MANKPRRKKGSSSGAAVRLIAIVLVALLALSAVVSALVSLAYAEERGRTELTVSVDERYEGVRITQRTLYVNPAEKSLDQVLFSVPANLLRRLSTAPYEDMQAAYPDGFSPCGADILSVAVDEQAANYGLRGAGEEFMRVDCALAPGQSAWFTFVYEIPLSLSRGFLGIGESGWRLTGFYFYPAVYDAALETFALEDRDKVNNGGFAPAQDMTVTVDAPDTYTVAASGDIARAASENGRARTTVSLAAARDMALVLYPNGMTPATRDGNGVTVRAYLSTHADMAVIYAERILARMMEMLETFPFDALAIMEADEPNECAAYAGAIYVDGALAAQGGDALERALALSIARQYFGQAVLANPVAEPWLNEALPAYMVLLYYEREYGYARFLDELNRNTLASLQVTLPGGLTVDADKQMFASREEYALILRGRGAAVMHETRVLLGSDAYVAAMREYLRAHANGIVSIGDLAEAFHTASGKAIDYFLMEMLVSIDDYVAQGIDWYE